MAGAPGLRSLWIWLLSSLFIPTLFFQGINLKHISVCCFGSKGTWTEGQILRFRISVC